MAGRPTCGKQARANKREIRERPFYSFASCPPLRALREEEKKKEKIIGAQSRQAAKSAAADAALRLGEKKNPPRRTGGHWKKKKTLFLRFKKPIPRKLPELPRNPHTAIEGV